MTRPPLADSLLEMAQRLAEREPQFRASVRFMLPEKGGRTQPMPKVYGCPCVLTNPAQEGNDARLLFGEDWTELGQDAVASFYFMGGEKAAKRYRDSGHFFLWEGRIIGEATVL